MMKKSLFNDLYDRLRLVNFRRTLPTSCPVFFTGISRFTGWFEYTRGWRLILGSHTIFTSGRKRLPAGTRSSCRRKISPADPRAGYAADLMDVYQLYSDLNFLEKGVDAAYDILTPWGSDKLVLPCRTPNVCRLLCNCYYLTGDAECGKLAGKLVMEALGYMRGGDCDDLLAWWDAICLYEDVVGTMELSMEEREYLGEERTRLSVRVKQLENKKIEYFQQLEDRNDTRCLPEVFDILARRAFDTCYRFYEKEL